MSCTIVQDILDGKIVPDNEILLQQTLFSDTIAHILAENGWTTEDKYILSAANNDGETVAHIQAKHGWTTDDPEILFLTDHNNVSVLDIIRKNNPDFEPYCSFHYDYLPDN